MAGRRPFGLLRRGASVTTDLSSAWRSETAGQAQVRLELINGFRLLHAGREVELPLQGQRLVAFLGLHVATGRDEVAGCLWPGATEKHAHGSLRSTLWRVHRQCAGLVAPLGSRLAITGVATDVAEWGRIAHDAQHAAIDAMPAATGTLLPGWYEDWVLLERERLRQLQLHGLEAVALLRLHSQDHAGALEAVLRAVALEPLRESAHRLAVRVHLAEGNVGEARRQYEACRRLLQDELGVAPSPGFRALLQDGR